ncbi:MgtC/SapB family protein [Trichothermofontia sichuanensis B231]|uniref:MgtC/SapB family protein n=1 Tax=Trichothermofontia sichuanensis TaxID=3045816 RepID=UPI002248153C|nr:MgtC/SapB family protein [Trichothermofontia sichuanensis]UZQ55588.1 MgtC/SapB family protein [Trichothermofontia sichuanensis B231]
MAIAIQPNDWLALTGRLALALAIGGVIGWEREITGKAAGLRTHMLVSLGAALFVLLPLQLSKSESLDANALSRVVQGIATGVGFLGAGEILHRSSQEGKPVVRGLTSAAAIWMTAALGITAGCGLWQVTLLGGLSGLFVLRVAKYFERRWLS